MHRGGWPALGWAPDIPQQPPARGRWVPNRAAKRRSPAVPGSPRQPPAKAAPSKDCPRQIQPRRVAPRCGATAIRHERGFGVGEWAGVLLRSTASPSRFQLAKCACPGELSCFLFFHKILLGAMFSSLGLFSITRRLSHHACHAGELGAHIAVLGGHEGRCREEHRTPPAVGRTPRNPRRAAGDRSDANENENENEDELKAAIHEQACKKKCFKT